MALVVVGVEPVQSVGNHKLQYCITQELETLIGTERQICEAN